jgi:hypothetical protein
VHVDLVDAGHSSDYILEIQRSGAWEMEHTDSFPPSYSYWENVSLHYGQRHRFTGEG